MTTAYKDLQDELRPGETVEGICFGEWGWGGYGENRSCTIPEDKRGVVLTLEEAHPLMTGWSFNGGYGAPDCFAVTIWTDQRILWVTQYDGATGLDSAPRNPIDHKPSMPGG